MKIVTRRLIPCPGCGQFVHGGTSSCPFCGGRLEQSQPRFKPLGRRFAALILFGVAAVPGCAYGGPPSCVETGCATDEVCNETTGNCESPTPAASPSPTPAASPAPAAAHAARQLAPAQHLAPRAP